LYIFATGRWRYVDYCKKENAIIKADGYISFRSNFFKREG